MAPLPRLLIFVAAIGVASLVWKDMENDLRTGQVTWMIGFISGAQTTHRIEKPFNYWSSIAMKAIVLAGAAAMAGITGYSLLQP